MDMLLISIISVSFGTGVAILIWVLGELNVNLPTWLLITLGILAGVMIAVVPLAIFLFSRLSRARQLSKIKGRLEWKEVRRIQKIDMLSPPSISTDPSVTTSHPIDPAQLLISWEHMREFKHSEARWWLFFNVLIINRSDTPLNIAVFFQLGFRLTEEAKAWSFSARPLDRLSALGNKNTNSLDNLLGSPLQIAPKGSAKGFMAFAIHDKNLEELESDSRFRLRQNKFMYLHIFDYITEKWLGHVDVLP